MSTTRPANAFTPFFGFDIEADRNAVEFLDARVLKEAEAFDTVNVLEAREKEMHAENLQIEADAMEIAIVELIAEHHAHDKDCVLAFELGADEELGEDVHVRDRYHQLAAQHQHAMPFRQGRCEMGVGACPSTWLA